MELGKRLMQQEQEVQIQTESEGECESEQEEEEKTASGWYPSLPPTLQPSHEEDSYVEPLWLREQIARQRFQTLGITEPSNSDVAKAAAALNIVEECVSECVRCGCDIVDSGGFYYTGPVEVEGEEGEEAFGQACMCGPCHAAENLDWRRVDIKEFNLLSEVPWLRPASTASKTEVTHQFKRGNIAIKGLTLSQLDRAKLLYKQRPDITKDEMKLQIRKVDRKRKREGKDEKCTALQCPIQRYFKHAREKGGVWGKGRNDFWHKMAVLLKCSQKSVKEHYLACHKCDTDWRQKRNLNLTCLVSINKY